MKQIWTVFVFTLKDAARKKAFKISTFILLLVIFAACLIVNLTSSGGESAEGAAGATTAGTGAETASGAAEEEAGQDITLEGVCYYVDEDAAIPGGMEALQAALPTYQVKQGDAAQLGAYRSEIAENGEVSLVLVQQTQGSPAVTVVTKDVLSGVNNSDVSDALNQQYIVNQLEAQGVTGDVAATLNFEIPVAVEIAGEMDLSGYVLGIVIVMLMFFAIYYYGYGVSMSIATEKTSRVMETLVVSAKPSRILIGKCLAMGALGLLQMAGVMLFAALCYHFLIPDNFTLMGMPLSLSSFTLTRAVIILAYFILGYALYAVMNAVCGASVSKIEDINSAMMPVVLIAMISFYLGYFTAISGSGTDSLLQQIAIYVPFCSPFIVPFKILNGDVATMDLILSLAALVVAIVLITALSIRIYTASVLHYGSRIKLKDMFKLRA